MTKNKYFKIIYFWKKKHLYYLTDQMAILFNHPEAFHLNALEY